MIIFNISKEIVRKWAVECDEKTVNAWLKKWSSILQTLNTEESNSMLYDLESYQLIITPEIRYELENCRSYHKESEGVERSRIVVKLSNDNESLELTELNDKLKVSVIRQ